MPRQYTRTPLFDRLISRVEFTDSCWLFTGPIDRNRYGRIREGGSQGRQLFAHRVAYELLIGPIPKGLQLDHLCRIRHCVNPSHLEPVSCRLNLLRGDTFNARNAKKTHCPKGHPYDLFNTWLYRGSRHCRACMKARGH